jgi:hypothetical protein
MNMPSGVTHMLFFCSLRYNFNSCIGALLRSVWYSWDGISFQSMCSFATVW